MMIFKYQVKIFIFGVLRQLIQSSHQGFLRCTQPFCTVISTHYNLICQNILQSTPKMLFQSAQVPFTWKILPWIISKFLLKLDYHTDLTAYTQSRRCYGYVIDTGRIKNSKNGSDLPAISVSMVARASMRRSEKRFLSLTTQVPYPQAKAGRMGGLMLSVSGEVCMII